MGFKGKDIISIRDLSRDDIEHILDVAAKMETNKKPLLSDKILALIFYEPSTSYLVYKSLRILDVLAS